MTCSVDTHSMAHMYIFSVQGHFVAKFAEYVQKKVIIINTYVKKTKLISNGQKFAI